MKNTLNYLFVIFILSFANGESTTKPVLLKWDDLGKTVANHVLVDGLYIYKPEYPESLKKLDGKLIRIKGFMLPMEESNRQKKFLFTPQPLTCGFCGGDDDEGLLFLEVFSPGKGIEMDWNPMEITGRLEIQYGKRAQEGLFFRLKEAKE